MMAQEKILKETSNSKMTKDKKKKKWKMAMPFHFYIFSNCIKWYKTAKNHTNKGSREKLIIFYNR